MAILGTLVWSCLSTKHLRAGAKFLPSPCSVSKKKLAPSRNTKNKDKQKNHIFYPLLIWNSYHWLSQAFEHGPLKVRWPLFLSWRHGLCLLAKRRFGRTESWRMVSRSRWPGLRGGSGDVEVSRPSWRTGYSQSSSHRTMVIWGFPWPWGGSPIVRWLVFFEIFSHRSKWMMTGGVSLWLRKPPIFSMNIKTIQLWGTPMTSWKPPGLFDAGKLDATWNNWPSDGPVKQGDPFRKPWRCKCHMFG